MDWTQPFHQPLSVCGWVFSTCTSERILSLWQFFFACRKKSTCIVDTSKAAPAVFLANTLFAGVQLPSPGTKFPPLLPLVLLCLHFNGVVPEGSNDRTAMKLMIRIIEISPLANYDDASDSSTVSGQNVVVPRCVDSPQTSEIVTALKSTAAITMRYVWIVDTLYFGALLSTRYILRTSRRGLRCAKISCSVSLHGTVFKSVSSRLAWGSRQIHSDETPLEICSSPTERSPTFAPAGAVIQTSRHLSCIHRMQRRRSASPGLSPVSRNHRGCLFSFSLFSVIRRRFEAA